MCLFRFILFIRFEPLHFEQVIDLSFLDRGYLFTSFASIISNIYNQIISVVEFLRYFLLVRKVTHDADVFTQKHTELPASSFSIILCLVYSQARIYEINYIDQQFIIITKTTTRQEALSSI